MFYFFGYELIHSHWDELFPREQTVPGWEGVPESYPGTDLQIFESESLYNFIYNGSKIYYWSGYDNQTSHAYALDRNLTEPSPPLWNLTSQYCYFTKWFVIWSVALIKYKYNHKHKKAVSVNPTQPKQRWLKDQIQTTGRIQRIKMISQLQAQERYFFFFFYFHNNILNPILFRSLWISMTGEMMEVLVMFWALKLTVLWFVKEEDALEAKWTQLLITSPWVWVQQ